MLEGRLRLGDGRQVAYVERGRRGGKPVLHCHGLPGSRLECWGGEAAYAGAGVRLITPDRPGIGQSGQRGDREVWQWADDVAQLADALNIDRFAVAGHSAGAAYALACGHALGDRVAGVAIIAGVPRLDRPEAVRELGTSRSWNLAGRRPGLMRGVLTAWSWSLRTVPGLGHHMFFRHASPADRAAVDRPDVKRRFRAAALEAVRHGTRGIVDDMRALMRPWGFSPAQIRSAIHIWQGSDDLHVPPQVGDRYAACSPDAEATLVPGEGHFSLFENRASEIMTALVRHAAL